MNKNTAIGIVLIAILFIWSLQNSTKRQELTQAELQRKATEIAALEKARQDSLAAIKGKSTEAGVVEMVASPGAQAMEPALAEDESAEAIEEPATLSPREIRVVTNRFAIGLNTVGAKITSIVPKTLADSLGFPELLQIPEDGALSIEFGSDEDKSREDFSQAIFSVAGMEGIDSIVVQDSASVVFEWKDKRGRTIAREYKFSKDGHSIGHETRIKGFTQKRYTLHWKGGMRETEAIPTTTTFGMNYLFSEVIFNNTYNVERQTLTNRTWLNKQGKAYWFGLRRKYIAAVINFNGASDASLAAEPITSKKNSKDQGTYALTVVDYIPDNSVISFDFSILPLRWHEIEAMGKGYEKIIVGGWEWIGADKWFVWLCGLLLKILNAFYSIIPNYGVAIILLTIFVKAVTTPLSVKQLRSTRTMMALKPELDAIRAKNRGDMRTQQQEVMALYARHGISPLSGLSGCFPMLLQMPIFIGLFVVLGRAIELREAPFFAWISDLSKTDVIWSGISIPYIMPNGIAVLPFLMVVSTWYQTKQTITDPNHRMMVWMMPAMMFVFSAVMPSGLVLYWTVSNVWGIAQFMVINRKPLTLGAGTASKAPAKVVEAKVIKEKKRKKK